MSHPQPFAPPVPALSAAAAPPPVPAMPTYASPGQTHVTGYSTIASSHGHPRLVTDRREPNAAAVAIAWISTVILLGYMLPWAIAATRGKSNQAAIGLVNLLLGWTVVGWVVALVMACGAHQLAGGGPTTIVVSQVGPGHGTSSSVSPAAGWFPSPDGNGQQYWDGARWTGHRAP